MLKMKLCFIIQVMVKKIGDLVSGSGVIMEEIFQKIENCLKKNNLSYEKIFDRCDGKMQVIVYQYSTLYMETFIIHRDYILTK